jgi:hypothetical protein
MKNFTICILLIAVIVATSVTSLAEQSNQGSFSLVTSPRVMVYMDGRRVGMSPLLNHRMSAGEHSMALLLIMPNGNRLRADYRVIVVAGRETSASLDLVRDAPREGEVRTLSPAQPQRAQPQPNPPVKAPAKAATNPPVQANPAQANPAPQKQSSWATNPGRPSKAPVTVAPRRRPDPPPPPPPPEPTFGLTRELVREGLEAMRPAVERCMGGRTGVVQVRMVIQNDGGIAEVEAQGVYRGTTAGECIERTLPEEAAFPIYVGDPIPVVYPYRIAEQ